MTLNLSILFSIPLSLHNIFSIIFSAPSSILLVFSSAGIICTSITIIISSLIFSIQTTGFLFLAIIYFFKSKLPVLFHMYYPVILVPVSSLIFFFINSLLLLSVLQKLIFFNLFNHLENYFVEIFSYS